MRLFFECLRQEIKWLGKKVYEGFIGVLLAITIIGLFAGLFWISNRLGWGAGLAYFLLGFLLAKAGIRMSEIRTAALEQKKREEKEHETVFRTV